jgi:GNAT superfamily N-acetyltransferase
VVSTVGLVLAWQNMTGRWESWAYAWALVGPTATGVGSFLGGLRTGNPRLRDAGMWQIAVGLALFGGFYLFFELIAYRDGRPVGWISVAPRPDYGRVIRSPSIGPGRRSPEAADSGVWSVVCFWMPRAQRGKGIAMALLRAAVEHARSGGARVLEAYPIDTGEERHPQSSVFTGTLAMFRRVGFTEVERRTEGRPIVRLSLD